MEIAIGIPFKTDRARIQLDDFSGTTSPITWRSRRSGEHEAEDNEMGSRYLFICLYVWLEKYFSAGDYRRTAQPAAGTTGEGR